jgi:hypothetical protein
MMPSELLSDCCSVGVGVTVGSTTCPLSTTVRDEAPKVKPPIELLFIKLFNELSWLPASLDPALPVGAAPPSKTTEPYFTPKTVMALESEPPMVVASNSIKVK